MLLKWLSTNLPMAQHRADQHAQAIAQLFENNGLEYGGIVVNLNDGTANWLVSLKKLRPDEDGYAYEEHTEEGGE